MSTSSLICRTCGVTFEDARAFGLHRVTIDGRVRCVHPASVGLVQTGSIFDRPRRLYPPSRFDRRRRR